MGNVGNKLPLVLTGIISRLDQVFQACVEAAEFIVPVIDRVRRSCTVCHPVFRVAGSRLGNLIHRAVQPQIKDGERKEREQEDNGDQQIADILDRDRLAVQILQILRIIGNLIQVMLQKAWYEHKSQNETDQKKAKVSGKHSV